MNVCSVCQRSILRFPFCDSKECVGNLSKKIHFYTDQLQSSSSSLEEVIKGIVSELVQTQGIIYITGVGKSGHIARKTIATWQSLGIRAHFLSPQDALHGDVGILRKEDLVIHISNSGNTEELLLLAEHIQQKKIRQILVSNNHTAKLASFIDFNFVLSSEKILEADSHGIVPSVSSIFYMIVLDLVGIYVAEYNGYKKDDFYSNHPSGELGKGKL